MTSRDHDHAPHRSGRPEDATAPGGAGGAGLGGSADSVLRDIQAMVEQLLGGAQGAIPSTLTIDELNSALAQATGGYNARPQAELGGLSPDDVQRLLDADWMSPSSAIRLDTSRTLDELAPSRTLDDARTVLGMMAERGSVKATPKGNLPRAFVAAFRERMRPRGSGIEERDHGREAAPRVLNEEDVWSLHTVRLLLELAGLVKRRKGVFSLTKRGVKLAGDEGAGELFALLLHTIFRRLNLEYLDRAAPAPGFQHTIAFTLYQFGREGAGWKRAGELVDALLLPAVRERLPVSQYFDEAALILETRFLRPLEGFALAEARELAREPGQIVARREWRKTALFDRVVTFGVGDG